MEENTNIMNNEEETLMTMMNLIGEGKANVGITLTQIQSKGNDVIGSMVLSERTLKEGVPTIHFGGKYVFLDLDFKLAKGMDSNAVNHILKQWLDKSTDSVVGEKKEIQNSYYFIMDIIAIGEDGYTYGFKLINPAFWTMEETTLKMSYDQSNITIYKQDVDYSAIEKQKRRAEIAEMERKGMMPV